MRSILKGSQLPPWKVEKIAVIGPGIVGLPMAALLADSRIRIGGGQAARVVVLQRGSPTSGWKVEALNRGRTTIGGVEPELERIVVRTVAAGLLSASQDYEQARDADVILVCVQTDRQGDGPDYGPLFEALHSLAAVLRRKPAEKRPLLIFESTLAPSSMTTLIREHFASYGLEEGRDLLLGNSPNRVMPGRLVERIRTSDKLAGGLREETPRRILELYGHLLSEGRLQPTNSLTAEIVKTLENAYRDVRIAFSAELARYCDEQDLDFYRLREEVNRSLGESDAATADPNAVPTGGLLIPLIGVGGHCLPKDGILLWWRRREAEPEAAAGSLLLGARAVNDASPGETVRLAERHFGPLAGRPVALLGAAYRFNSEDTRNSPTLALAGLLLEKGCRLTIHDPYVKPTDQNLVRRGLQAYFTGNVGQALGEARLAVFCTAHAVYRDGRERILAAAPHLEAVLDGCNLYRREDFASGRVGYAGIGRGSGAPERELVDFVRDCFRLLEGGVAQEVLALCEFYNRRYAQDAFNQVSFEEVRRLAATCGTGCRIAEPAPVQRVPSYRGFSSRLLELAAGARVLEPAGGPRGGDS